MPGETHELEREMIEKQRQAAEQAARAAECKIAQATDASASVTRAHESVTITRTQETVEYQKKVERVDAHSSNEVLAAQRVETAGDFESAAEKRIIGRPEEAKRYFHYQGEKPRCAINTQQGILEERTGRRYDNEELTRKAIDQHWYTEKKMPDGSFEGGTTNWKSVGKLLESEQVPIKRWDDGADLDVLKNQLNQGHDVITGVDAGALWRDARYANKGHAIWVTGVETDANGQVTAVIANDTAFERGQAVRYDAATFRKAWQRRGNVMIATA